MDIKSTELLSSCCGVWQTVRVSVCVFLPSGWSQQRRTRRDTSRATSNCQTARHCWPSAWTCTACSWRPCRRAAARFSPPHTGRWTAPPAGTLQATGRSFCPTAALQPKKPTGGRELLASYSLQSLELLLGWIIDRVAHWCGNNQLLRGHFFHTTSFSRAFTNSCIFYAAGLEGVFRAQFLRQDQRTVTCWGKPFSHCRLLIEAWSYKQTFKCLSAACEIVGRDTWLRNTSSAIIDFHNEDSN